MDGALIEAEILTSQLPMYLLNLAQFLGTNTLPSGVSASPKQSRNVSMCLRNFQKNLVHGALIEAEILTSPLPYVFAQLSPVLSALALYLSSVCNTSQVYPEMFLCVSGTSKKNLVHGALIEAEILTSQLLMYLLNLAQFLGTQYSAYRCVSISQVV